MYFFFNLMLMFPFLDFFWGGHQRQQKCLSDHFGLCGLKKKKKKER